MIYFSMYLLVDVLMTILLVSTQAIYVKVKMVIYKLDSIMIEKAVSIKDIASHRLPGGLT